MDLSPNDIRNYEFDSQMRGYDKDDVRDFLEQIATALETAKQQELKLSMEIDSLKTQLSGLRQFEDTIKSAAIDARRNADMTVGNAKKEAELIVARARTDADEIIGSRASKVTQVEDQITKLQLTKKSYITKLRNLIKSHMEMVEELSADDQTATSSDDGIVVTESADVTRDKFETISNEPSSLEPIKSEEVNATDTIVPPKATVDEAISQEPSTVTDSEQPDVTSDQNKSADSPVDPELAAALESYKGELPQAKDDDTKNPEQETPAPSIDGGFIETTARAEDIPDGFISMNSENSEKNSTDKIKTELGNQAEETEHNAIDIDKVEPDKKQPMNTEDLANELDKVAAKFEEEMDKAAKA